MDRKSALLAVIDHGRKLGEDLASRLSDGARNANGTFQRWAAKDVFAHSTEWLARDVKRLESRKEPLPSLGGDHLEDDNKAIFDKYADWSWDEIYRFYNETFERASRLAESMSPETIGRELELADGSRRTPWRLLAGHAVMHHSQHLSLVYEREGFGSQSTEMEETTAKVLAQLDDSPEWTGTILYNLACHYALTGNTGKAVSLLREALEKNPQLTEWSREDTDLDGIRDDPEFRSIYSDV